MPKFMNRGGGNAAPNYVPYTEKRTEIPHDNTVPISISGVNRNSMFSAREETRNNKAYINGQTFFAAGVIKTPQGFAPGSQIAVAREAALKKAKKGR